MKTSANIASICGAFVAAQAKFQSVSKDKTAKIEGKSANYAYKYANLASILDEVRPVLGEHKLGLIQTTGQPHADTLSVTTTLIHESGEWIESEPLILPVDGDRAQSIGSAITYARRYSLCAMLGIGVDDDDGADAKRSPVQQRRSWSPPRPAEAAHGNGKHTEAQSSPEPSQDRPEGKSGFWAIMGQWTGLEPSDRRAACIEVARRCGMPVLDGLPEAKYDEFIAHVQEQLAGGMDWLEYARQPQTPPPGPAAPAPVTTASGAPSEKSQQIQEFAAKTRLRRSTAEIEAAHEQAAREKGEAPRDEMDQGPAPDPSDQRPAPRGRVRK